MRTKQREVFTAKAKITAEKKRRDPRRIYFYICIYLQILYLGVQTAALALRLFLLIFFWLFLKLLIFYFYLDFHRDNKQNAGVLIPPFFVLGVAPCLQIYEHIREGLYYGQRSMNLVPIYIYIYFRQMDKCNLEQLLNHLRAHLKGRK